MVKKSIAMALDTGGIRAGSLYGLTDPGFERLFEGRKEAWAGLARRAFQRDFHVPALEARPGDLSERVAKLEDRFALEEELAIELGLDAADVVIDLPEEASFETGLVVRDAGKPFMDSGTVFGRETVRAFSENLRLARVLVSREALERLRPGALTAISRLVRESGPKLP